MLAILPVGAFAGLFLVLGNRFPDLGWRRAFLRAILLWGVYAVLATEFLSLIRGITPWGLAVAWVAPMGAAGIWFLGAGDRGIALQLPALAWPSHWLDRLMVLGVVVVLALTALVAWLTPPQTWDSLNYHLPRVAHWAQERAVRHFATGIDVQNSMPPGSEVAILQFYVLMGGDRLANFVQWFALLASLVGVSLIARQLGAGRGGQLLAVVVTATIPMGIVQATSTMTDYVVSLWALCVAVETLDLILVGPTRNALVASSLAAGLALYSKPTSAAYIAPFALLTAIALFRRLSLGRSLGWALVAALLVAALNSGHLIRNTSLYGNPISGKERIGLHANQLMNLQGMLSNGIRNAALHTGTPKASINEWIYGIVLDLHDLLGVDPSDPRTTSVGPYQTVGGFATHEDVVGNPIHAGLILLALPATLLGWKRLGSLSVVYVLAATATFLLFSLLFKWQIFGTRYHLPFFVLFAPSIGLVFDRLMHVRTGRLAGMALLIAAIPWLLSINSRPLFPLPNRAYVDSILVEPRKKLYYANGLGLIPIHDQMASMIREKACTSVGIAIAGGGAEYPIWVQLGAPDPELQVEWLVGGTPSERYEKPDFQPCAVICQKCPDQWQELRGLPRVYDQGQFRLFLQP